MRIPLSAATWITSGALPFMTDMRDSTRGPRPAAHGPHETRGLVHVAAAALVNTEGAVLLTRRHDEAHQGGLWEFPGGKLEPGESVSEGLHRELREELGVVPEKHRPLIRVRHVYEDREVLLDVHLVTVWDGEATGLEGQPLTWVPAAQLDDYPMPPADVPIVRALQLPSTYLITPPRLADRETFLAQLDASLRAGVSLVQLRLFDLPRDELVALGREVCRLCHARDARVLLNGDPALARTIDADGLHLNSRELHAHTPTAAADGLLAASCHSPEDLARAAAIDADFALLSPVLPTRSHPDAEPLGWPRFARWVDDAALPVYALGGMHPDLLKTAWQYGAQGIAAIRGLWRDEPAG
jgi:8-oxo-dGTP diphosphatase